MSNQYWSSWRGVVGVIKPNMRPEAVRWFFRLLPDGIGVILSYLEDRYMGEDLKRTEKDYLGLMEPMKEKIAEMAKLNVDVIHPEGGPYFMIWGYKRSEEIVRTLEQQHGIPIITTGMTVVEALRALKIKKIVGVTYLPGISPQKSVPYFTEAGFEMLCMESMPIPYYPDVERVSSQEVYAFIKQQFLKHPDAEGIYVLGSRFTCLDIIQVVEQDLGIPVVHPVPARIWAIQKRLHVREPIKGYGRLLEEMP